MVGSLATTSLRFNSVHEILVIMASASSESSDEMRTFYSSSHSDFCKNIPEYSSHALDTISQHVTTAQRNKMENGIQLYRICIL